VPDRILLAADEIRLVDLSPAALRERIARGLVYPPEGIDRALTGFFTIENLTALRALVLHELSELAEAELQRVQSRQEAHAGERVMVAVGGRADSMPKLIRSGVRLARRSDSELYVLVIEPEDGRVDPGTAGVLAEAEELTRTLGGTFLRRRAADAAAEIVSEAEAQRATVLVLGRSHRSRLRSTLGGSFIESVLRRTGGIDVYIVGTRSDPSSADRTADQRSSASRQPAE
jgi:two-component system sensor histidine kinase KdpD